MAKKFTYRFENILRLKEYNTNIAKEALNYTLKLKYDKEQQIEEFYSEIHNAYDKDITKVFAYLLQTSANHVAFIEDEIKKAKAEIMELEEIISLRRLKLTEALKEEKIMQKLREKKLEEHQYNLNREETAMFDEIAGRRARTFDGIKLEID
jgi:flagellar FliJ protein